MGQTSRVHQHPAETALEHAAVVSKEPRSTALIVDLRLIQCYVDGVRRSVVVWPQTILLLRPVAHQEVHDRLALRVVAAKHFAVVRDDELSQEVEPLLLKADLSHVNVNRRHILVASSQARVFVLPCNTDVLLLMQSTAGND